VKLLKGKRMKPVMHAANQPLDVEGQVETSASRLCFIFLASGRCTFSFAGQHRFDLPADRYVPVSGVAHASRSPIYCGSSRSKREVNSGFSPIRAAGCRAGEHMCILIRPVSRKRNGVVPSGARCDSPVLLTPACLPNTSGRSPCRPESPMTGRSRPVHVQQGRTTQMSTR
jgi:hypothetical protein